MGIADAIKNGKYTYNNSVPLEDFNKWVEDISVNNSPRHKPELWIGIPFLSELSDDLFLAIFNRCTVYTNPETSEYIDKRYKEIKSKQNEIFRSI